MNEIIYLIQIILIAFFSLGSFKLGKEALVACASIYLLAANLFVIKQMDIFGFHVTCSDAFAIGSLFSLNLLREFFGKEIAKKTIWICFFSFLFFVLVAQVHLFYRPNHLDFSQPSYLTILSLTPRLFFASLAVFFFVQQFDLALFSFLKDRFSSMSLNLRCFLCLLFSQFIDTLAFSFLGLYGIVDSISEIIIASFCLKVATILIILLFIPFTKKIFLSNEL
ncbi:MAG: queuosine precursor transporter [Chlamydiae bacterium]|nr:queuosine precursor transporter [Chlamydiota bacterium]